MFLKGCWMLPLKKVAVLKISNCWWGFLGTFVTSMLLLHLPDNLSRHGGVEIDCVVPQALSCLVTLSTATFEWFAYADLRSVAVLGVVLYTVHILWARKQNVSGQVVWYWLGFLLKKTQKLINVTGKITQIARNSCFGVTQVLGFQDTRWDKKEKNLCGSNARNVSTWPILIFISQRMALPKPTSFTGLTQGRSLPPDSSVFS